MIGLGRLLSWMRANTRHTITVTAAVYLVGFLLLAAGWVTGFLGAAIHAAGWVFTAILVLVGLHVRAAFSALALAEQKKPDFVAAESKVGWLEKIDGTILSLGFLGKLLAIALVCGGIGGTDAAAGVTTIAHGVSQALYSTALGLGFSIWTHTSTLLVTNHVNALQARKRK